MLFVPIDRAGVYLVTAAARRYILLPTEFYTFPTRVNLIITRWNGVYIKKYIYIFIVYSNTVLLAFVEYVLLRKSRTARRVLLFYFWSTLFLRPPPPTKPTRNWVDSSPAVLLAPRRTQRDRHTSRNDRSRECVYTATIRVTHTHIRIRVGVSVYSFK